MRALFLAALMLCVGLAGCNDEPLSGCDPSTIESSRPVAVMTTNVGVICAELFTEMTPVTANNFIGVAEAGEYDGTPFHRIISGFMMQGGDTTNGDGTGGKAASGFTIPDEFHHGLRHDRGGLLSMANRGANTGSSQFFITFVPTPHLDDKHSIFGEVISGMEIVDTVDSKYGSRDGAPTAPVTLESVVIKQPTLEPSPEGAVDLWTPQATHGAGADAVTEFLVVVENGFETMEKVQVAARADEGMTADVEVGFRSFDLAAGQRAAFIVTVTNDADGGTAFVDATIGEASDTLELTVETIETGPPVEEGQEVRAHYIGMTVDGRIFDTSVQAVADEADADESRAYGTFVKRPSYNAFTFTPGGGVIKGFTDLATRLDEGATGAGRIAPQDAYGKAGQHALAGRTLIFQLQVLEVL